MKCGDVIDIEEERMLRAGQILCGNAIDIRFTEAQIENCSDYSDRSAVQMYQMLR